MANPFDWASAVTGGLGSVLGYLGQKETNKANAKNVQATNEANLQISRETNELNKEMAEKANLLTELLQQRQFDFNASEAQRQRDWDSPVNQVSRLLAAGLSPSLATSGAGMSPASGSSASGSSGNPMSSAIMQPFRAENPVPTDALIGLSRTLTSLTDIAEQRRHNKQSELQQINDYNQREEAIQLDRQRVENESRTADSTVAATQSQIQYQDALTQKALADTYAQDLLNSTFYDTLKSDLRVNDAKATELIKSVANQAVAIANDLHIAQLHEGNESYRFWSNLSNHITEFDSSLMMRGKELGLTQQQIDNAEKHWQAEFDAAHGGYLTRVIEKLGLDKGVDLFSKVASGIADIKSLGIRKQNADTYSRNADTYERSKRAEHGNVRSREYREGRDSRGNRVTIERTWEDRRK